MVKWFMGDLNVSLVGEGTDRSHLVLSTLGAVGLHHFSHCMGPNPFAVAIDLFLPITLCIMILFCVIVRKLQLSLLCPGLLRATDGMLNC